MTTDKLDPLVAGRLTRQAPSALVARPPRSTTDAMRVALVGEGAYPFYPGGVSLFCHQLIKGMPDVSFIAVALTVDGTERSTWTAQENLIDVVNIPLWGPAVRRRNRHRGPFDSFDDYYQMLLRSILRPVTRQYEQACAEEFTVALHGLYEHAQGGNLTEAFSRNEPLDLLRRTWHDAGVDSGNSGGAAPLTLDDAVTVTNRIEHLLRPLSCPPVRADVCHLTMNGTSALVGLASKWAFGTRMVVSEHGIYLRERYLGLASDNVSPTVKVIATRFNRRLAAATYLNADIMAPHSMHNRRWQLYGGADPTRVRVMYNGINPDDFPLAKDEPADPTIVYVGRIDPLKDLHTLIRAFALVRERIPAARLRMFGPVPAGNEQYHASCARLVVELGLSDAATFEGRIPSQADAYEAGHLVALTSVSEGFPYTVVESMSMGRPVVCTNVGGISEAVGNAGFVVPPTDHVAVAHACIRLLMDPHLRRSLGILARQRVLERFTLHQWSNAYREIYAELASVPRSNDHALSSPKNMAAILAPSLAAPEPQAVVPSGRERGTFLERGGSAETWARNAPLAVPIAAHRLAAGDGATGESR